MKRQKLSINEVKFGWWEDDTDKWVKWNVGNKYETVETTVSYVSLKFYIFLLWVIVKVTPECIKNILIS